MPDGGCGWAREPVVHSQREVGGLKKIGKRLPALWADGENDFLGQNGGKVGAKKS